MMNDTDKMPCTKINDDCTSFSSKERLAQLDALCGFSQEARSMLARLREIQQRIGGPEERPADEDEAGALAHKLNNLLIGYVN